MLEFKRFETAAITISGIELAEKVQKNISSRRERCQPDPQLLQTSGTLCWPPEATANSFQWRSHAFAEFAPEPNQRQERILRGCVSCARSFVCRIG